MLLMRAHFLYSARLTPSADAAAAKRRARKALAENAGAGPRARDSARLARTAKQVPMYIGIDAAGRRQAAKEPLEASHRVFSQGLLQPTSDRGFVNRRDERR